PLTAAGRRPKPIENIPPKRRSSTMISSSSPGCAPAPVMQTKPHVRLGLKHRARGLNQEQSRLRNADHLRGRPLAEQLKDLATSIAAAATTAVLLMCSPATSQVAPYVTLQPEKFRTQIDGKP